MSFDVALLSIPFAEVPETFLRTRDHISFKQLSFPMPELMDHFQLEMCRRNSGTLCVKSVVADKKVLNLWF
jgi:hypothetical protein